MSLKNSNDFCLHSHMTIFIYVVALKSQKKKICLSVCEKENENDFIYFIFKYLSNKFNVTKCIFD